MLRCITLWSGLGILVLGSLAEAASDVTVTVATPRAFDPCRLFVPHVAKPITVDGRLDEWGDRKPLVVLNRATISRWGAAHLRVDGDEDLSAKVWLAWDRTHLYVAADVTDESLQGGAKGKDWSRLSNFGVDSVILGLHSSLHSGVNRSGSDVQYYLSYYAPGGTPRPLWGNGRYVAQARPGGYRVEAALPFARMVLAAQPGDRLSYYVIVTDLDESASGPTDWGQYLGTGTTELLPGISRHPELRLMPAGADVGGDLILRPKRFRTGDTMEALACVDALSKGGSIRDVRIQDTSGVTRWQAAVGRPLPAGATTLATLRFRVPALSPGAYVLDVGLGRDKALAHAQTAFRVERGEASAPSALPQRIGTVRVSRFHDPNVAPPYEPMKVTRDTYMKLLDEACRTQWQVSLDDLRAGRFPDRGAWTPFEVPYLVLLYKVTGEQVFADLACKVVRTFVDEKLPKTDPVSYGQATFAVAYKLMKEAGRLTPDDDRRWRRLIVECARRYWARTKRLEHTNNNRCFHYMLLYGVALKIDPTVPEASVWKPFVEQSWDYFWKVRDVDENTTGYGLADLKMLCSYATFMGHDAYFKDPEALQFQGRIAHELTPSGLLAPYGDGGHLLNGYTLIGHFELLARLTRDGRYKWAAHRLFEHLVRNKIATPKYPLTSMPGAWGQMFHPLLWALYYCDDTVPEVVPTWGSELLTRKKVIRTTGEEWRKAIYWKMADEPIPHKLILRSGWHPDDLFASIELVGDAGHAPGVPTQVNLLCAKRSVLLMDQNLKSRKHHNLVYLEDLEGFQVPEEEVVSVPLCTDHKAVTLATVRADGFQLLPVTEQRTFVFAKNRFLFVKDHLTFKSRGRYRVSCRWHGQEMGRQSGPNWVNLYTEALEDDLPGLRYVTYDHDLLVWYTPKADRALWAGDLGVTPLFKAYGFQSFCPLEVRQEWEGSVRPGGRLHFTTLLVPHTPMWDMSGVLKDIRLVEDTADRTVVMVRSRGRWCWVVHNRTGATVTVGPAAGRVTTDARVLYVESDGTPEPDKGQMRYGVAADTTRVQVGGKRIHDAKTRTTVEWPQ